MSSRPSGLKLLPVTMPPELEFWGPFEAERPRILGALLNAVIEGLKRLADTHLDKPPRMADFAK